MGSEKVVLFDENPCQIENLNNSTKTAFLPDYRASVGCMSTVIVVVKPIMETKYH
jgi:hypothetical protein